MTQSREHRRDCHPLSCPVPRDFSRSRVWIPCCRLQFGAAKRNTDLQDELRPVQSPLLRPSQLVSFPPLSYMLKFSGSSHSIGGLIQGCSRFARTKRYAAPSVQTLECVEKTQSFYRTRTPERGQSDTVPSALRATRSRRFERETQTPPRRCGEGW